MPPTVVLRQVTVRWVPAGPAQPTPESRELPCRRAGHRRPLIVGRCGGSEARRARSGADVTVRLRENTSSASRSAWSPTERGDGDSPGPSSASGGRGSRSTTAARPPRPGQGGAVDLALEDLADQATGWPPTGVPWRRGAALGSSHSTWAWWSQLSPATCSRVTTRRPPRRSPASSRVEGRRRLRADPSTGAFQLRRNRSTTRLCRASSSRISQNVRPAAWSRACRPRRTGWAMTALRSASICVGVLDDAGHLGLRLLPHLPR